MTFFWLLWGCVFPYGEPLVSHIPVNSAPKRVDFSSIEKQLNELLLSEQDRNEVLKLQELERLLIKAKGWHIREQQDLFGFAERYLEQFQAEELEMQGGEDSLDMELSFETVSIEDTDVASDLSERLQTAQQLVADGNIIKAVILLEECRDQPCWRDVYVYWAEYMDTLFAQRLQSLKAQNLSPQDEWNLWTDIEKEFPYPQFITKIAREKERLKKLLDAQ